MDGNEASAKDLPVATSGDAGQDIPPTAMEIAATVEALLFVSPEPLTLRQLQGAFPGSSREAVQAGVDLLAAALGDAARGLQLQEIAGGYRIATKPEQDSHIRALTAQKRKQRLSPAARETLAIVAYKQPITAPEITEIRGVDCGSAIKGLLERKLIRILGRKEVVGRPILYGTTRDFLVHFGLKGLEDLPTLQDFEEITMGIVSGEDGVTESVDAGEVRELVAAQDARDGTAEEADEGDVDDPAMEEE